MTDPKLSIIIPFYNEAQRFKKTLPLIRNFIDTAMYSCELILCDDGSHDDTSKVIPGLMGDTPYVLLQSPINQGKGSAVRRGMLRANGEYILFSDADLSTPLEEVYRFIKYLADGFDIVIGSRALDRSRVEVRQNIIRETMGKVFNRAARFLSFHEIHDSQCGFKCFKRSVAHDLFSVQKLNGFAFDAEILYLAQRRGYKIKEEPVVWRNEPQSRVHIFSDPVHMFLDLLKIRWMHRNTFKL